MYLFSNKELRLSHYLYELKIKNVKYNPIDSSGKCAKLLTMFSKHTVFNSQFF